MIVLEKILMLFYPKRCLLCGRAGAVNGDELCADCAKLQPDIRVRFFALHAGRRDYTLECRAPQQGAVSVILVAVQVQKRDETCETACKVNAAGDR